MLEEFKKFAIKGNVVDMAVGIIIGAAFSDIVKSFVSDVITPLTSPLLGNIDFSELMVGPVKLGLFINSLVSFIILAFSIFLVVKAINNLKKDEEEKKEKGPSEIDLLSEIRDSLKNKS
jgi:large conductance mechanosensitive channel